MSKNYLWIARDEDKRLFVYSCKPRKLKKMGQWHHGDTGLYIYPGLFPTVKWEDKEPKKLVLEEL